MNNEIKEILDEEVPILQLSYRNYVSLNKYLRLKNYITNLQQAVKDTKDSADDMLYELKRENESLRARIKTIKRLRKKQTAKKNRYKTLIFNEEKSLKDYKSRCEKAIEYIENDWYKLNTLDIEHCINLGKDIRIDLLNILQNGSDKQ